MYFLHKTLTVIAVGVIMIRPNGHVPDEQSQNLLSNVHTPPISESVEFSMICNLAFVLDLEYLKTSHERASGGSPNAKTM